LLGLDWKKTLQVTDCFPFPTKLGDDEEEGEAESSLGGAEYQIEMMRCLREVNVDNNTVGWYSSTYMGSFLNESTLETQYNYQHTISKSVVLIYDPLKTSQGILALKAFRLTQAFMEIYKPNQPFTKDSLTKGNISFQEIFEEIPIKIHNSFLVEAFLHELEEKGTASDSAYERLDLSTNPFLEKNLEFLIECLDDLSQEQNKFQYYQRNLQKQQYQQNQWVQKRKLENIARKKAGEEILPEEDSSNPIFKPIPEPNRLESVLITNQINNYCKQLNQFSATSLSKVYLLGALQKDQ
jgi:translation initiation factor 3 subunit H